MEATSDDERTNNWNLFAAIRKEKLEEFTELLEKVDVHIVDKNNKDNTPLHYAVEKNREGMVKAMLEHPKWRMIINAKNSSRETALDIAVRKEYEEVRLLLEDCAQPIVENEREQHLENHEEICEITQSASVANKSEDEKTCEKDAGSLSMRGYDYEISLAMLFLLHGTLEKRRGKIDRFSLVADLKSTGEFDDVVYERVYEDEGTRKTKMLFVQCKHRNQEGKTVTMETLLSDTKNDFSLKNFLRSYREIRKRFAENKSVDRMFGGKLEDCEFIIFTNASFSRYKEYEEHVTKKTVDEESVFNFKNDEKGTKHYIQLSLDGSMKKKLMSATSLASDCSELATELRDAVLSGNPVEPSKNMMSKYYCALRNHVIEGDNAKGKLRKTFCQDPDATEFSKIFFAEVMKKGKWNGRSLEEVKQILGGMEIRFSDAFGNVEATDQTLPVDVVTESEVTDCFGKLKLFFGQPNDLGISEVIKKRMWEAYRTMHPDMGTVYTKVYNKLAQWKTKRDAPYLTEDNSFFQEAAESSFWFEVEEPNRLFTGRKRELRELNEKLLRNRDEENCAPQSRMIWLSGSSGVGKSELVRAYIREYSREFDNNIVWIDAKNGKSRFESFRRLGCDKLNLLMNTDEEEGQNVTSFVPKVYQCFYWNTSLFIFDGVDDITDLNAFLPPGHLESGTRWPYVLFTSCRDSWDTEIETMLLGPLTRKEAKEMVKKGLEGTTEESKNDSISKLVEMLHYSHQAIEKAILDIRDKMITRRFTIKDYIRIYEKGSEQHLNSTRNAREALRALFESQPDDEGSH